MIPKALFIAINLICITISTYAIVDGVYDRVVTGVALPPAAMYQAKQGMKMEIPTKPISAYQIVMDRNLFSTRVDPVVSTQTVDVNALEETRLELKLWGTVSGGPSVNYAVIEDLKTREQNLYQVGDAIQNAAVKDVLREKVVLTINGKDEILQMQDLDTGRGQTSTQTVAPSESPTHRALRIPIRRSYIESSLNDIGTLMSQAQIQPHMENGVSTGLGLSSIKPNSVFRRLGLRNGDVITGVDGNPLRAVDDAVRLLDNLKSAPTVSLQIKRRGQDQNIEYSIR